MLPCSLNPERISKNIDIFNWWLTDEEWNKMNKIELQICLFGSGPTNTSETGFFSATGPLQAVHEIDDDDE